MMATDDRKTPRHAAKHAAPSASSTRRATATPTARQQTRATSSATPERVRISDRSNVERQLSASSASNASRMAGQRRLTGSNRPSYARQDTSTRRSPAPLIAIALAALVVIVISFFAVRACLSSPAEQPEEEATEPQQVQTTADDVVTYQGVTFSIDESTTPAQVVFSEPDGGASGQLFVLEGTPVALILYDGVIIVPENRGGSWDIMAYVLGGDSLPTQVIGPDGSPVTGTGEIVEATLDGSVIHVTDSTGATTDVSLV